MREGTSGFYVTENNGKISIEYTDFYVTEFGDHDFERTYYFDEENSKKFVSELKKEYEGSLDEMIEAAFGRGFNDAKFWEFCKSRSIEYSSSTWS